MRFWCNQTEALRLVLLRQICERGVLTPYLLRTSYKSSRVKKEIFAMLFLGFFCPKCTRSWYDQGEVLRRVLLGPILWWRGVKPLFFADKLLRTAVSRGSSLRCNSLGSFWPNCTNLWCDQNEVLCLVLLKANLRKGGVNPLFFADKLRRPTV